MWRKKKDKSSDVGDFDDGDLLDFSMLDNPNALMRIPSLASGDQTNNRFRLTSRAAKQHVRERQSHCYITICSKFEMCRVVALAERYDLDVTHLYIAECGEPILSKLPKSFVILEAITCNSLEPDLLRFIHPGIKQIMLPSTGIKCFPFSLQAFLDRLGDVSYLDFSPCCFSDSPDWVYVLLRWLNSRTSEMEIGLMVLTVHHSKGDADLDNFLTVINDHVYRFVIRLMWRPEEVVVKMEKFPSITFIT